MLKQPSVTVIIPFKNKVQYLLSALTSVFNQSYKNYNIIIIYDNNDKKDLKKIKKFLKNNYLSKSRNVKFEVNRKNIGAGYSRNKGIKKSKSKYIAFLDADDLWEKNKLKYQIRFMEKNKKVFSHTSYYIIDEKDKIIKSRAAKSKISFNELQKSCDVGLSTVIIQRKFINENNLFFPNINTKEDFVLWLKVLKKLRFIFGIKKKYTFYRKTHNSLSSNKIISAINGYKVYRNYMNYSIFKSLYFLMTLSLNAFKKNFFK